jgi:hypothetical protein
MYIHSYMYKYFHVYLLVYNSVAIQTDMLIIHVNLTVYFSDFK